MAFVVAVVMRESVFGRYIFAMGGNELAARFRGCESGFTKPVFTWGRGAVWFGWSDAIVAIDAG